MSFEHVVTEPVAIEQFRSELAQKLIEWEGKPFSLEHYPMHVAFYDGNYKRIMLKMARQTAKSMSISAFMTSECVGVPFFKNYYISPSQEQTRKFSHTRIGKILNMSKMLRKVFVDSNEINNVLLRMFKNGSEMAFSYALDDPDRARGYSADRTSFDEIQDILYTEVVPVIESSMDNSTKGAFSLYAGTPKGMENTIEFLWSVSTQSEWVMKCEGCGKSTFIDSVKALGLHGPECLNCRKLLNPRSGRWVDLKPNPKSADGVHITKKIQGFHVPRPIMVENVPAAWPIGPLRDTAQILWQERVLDKMAEPPLGYGEIKFQNEVLGISSGTGTRLLEEADLVQLCAPNCGVPEYDLMRLPTPAHLNGINKTYMGVDWSGGGGEVKGTEGLVKSRTVCWVWGEMADGRLKLLYYKIFASGHIVGWVPEIMDIFDGYGCAMGCGDAGEGALANGQLRDRYGIRWTQVAYMALSCPIKWMADTLKFHADRTTLIDNYAMFLKQQRAVLAGERAMRPAIQDILNEYEETTRMGKKVWRHAPTQPDDCLHAGLFAWLAWRIVTQNLSFYLG